MLKRFIEKTKKKPVIQQTVELCKDERNVIRELCSVENLRAKEKPEVFSHEWTKYPSSLFRLDPFHSKKIFYV